MGSEKYRDKSGVYRAFGLERAEALRWTKSEVAQSGSTQSSDRAFWGLLSIFLTAAPYLIPELERPKLSLWRRMTRTWGSPLWSDLHRCRTDTSGCPFDVGVLGS